MDSQSALVYVGVGSNIHPEENVPRALEAISRNSSIALTGISTFYRTAPISDPVSSTRPPDQKTHDLGQDFLNGVLELRTDLSSAGLLVFFNQVEEALGRVRPGTPFAPRTMDLDLLLFGKENASGASPSWEAIGPSGYRAHNDIERRAFVAHPLLELAPDLSLPPHGVPLRAFAAIFDTPGGRPENDFSSGLRSRFLSR